jgi:hypothetical protein
MAVNVKEYAAFTGLDVTAAAEILKDKQSAIWHLPGGAANAAKRDYFIKLINGEAVETPTDEPIVPPTDNGGKPTGDANGEPAGAPTVDTENEPTTEPETENEAVPDTEVEDDTTPDTEPEVETETDGGSVKVED